MTDADIEFVQKQHVFFVASAPLAQDGHVNLSPKGLDTFKILGPNRCAYADLTGSAAETVAHVRENGRITLMFCAFDGKPNIVRLYGTARIVRSDDPSFESLAREFPEHRSLRSFVDVDIHKVGSSCGFGVPNYEYIDERDQLVRWSAGKSPDDLVDYWAKKNVVSLDGLPAVDLST